MMTYKDYYQILGVSRAASESEIRSAYRRLALKHHPDRNSGSKLAEEKFKEINEAYQVLSNTEKRAGYDALRHEAAPARESHQRPGNASRDDWSSSRPREGQAGVGAWGKIQQPASVGMTRSPEELEIVREWFSVELIQDSLREFARGFHFWRFLVTLGVGGYAFLFFFGFLAFLIWNIPSLFFVPMLLLLPLTYWVGANIFNRTHVNVTRHTITIRHGPLPFLHDWEIPVENLKLIFHERKYAFPLHTHEVCVITAEYEQITLLSRLSRKEALFIAQEIGQFLRLEDNLRR